MKKLSSLENLVLIEQAPLWLAKLFDRAQSLGISNPKFTGNTVNSIMFGGKYGPMVEPWYHHLFPENGEKQDDLGEEMVLSNFKDTYPRIIKDNDQFILIFHSASERASFEKGIIPDAYTGNLREVFTFFSGVTLDQGANERKKVARTYEDFAEESNNKIAVKHSHAIPDSNIVREIRDWHTKQLPGFSWVEQPQFSKLHEKVNYEDLWIADDQVFYSLLVKEAKLFMLTGKCINKNLERILLSQNTSQKGTHQGWETWQHAINSTLQLKTNDYDPNHRKGLRMGMLLHDIGKVNEAALWALGCHATYGAKTWLRLGLENLSAADQKIITYVIQNHDVFGLTDRAISEDQLPVKLNFSRMANNIEESPFGSWRKSIDVIADINDADIGSLPSLSFFKSLTPLLKRVFSDPNIIRGFANE